MIRTSHFLASLLLCPALLASSPASAAGCWKPDEVSAARVRELEVMMMAVTLRCKQLGHNLQPSLDRFRDAQKNAIQQADEKLKTRYAGENAKATHRAYDRFLTSLANFYGSGKTDTRSCGMFEMVAKELGKPSATPDTLASISMQMVRDPQLDGARCPVIAMKKAR